MAARCNKVCCPCSLPILCRIRLTISRQPSGPGHSKRLFCVAAIIVVQSFKQFFCPYCAGSISVIIGTLYKHMQLKPNILDECALLALFREHRPSSFSSTLSVCRYAGRSSASKSLSGPLVSDRLGCLPCCIVIPAPSPVPPSDTVVIEDESGRIQLKGASVRTPS